MKESKLDEHVRLQETIAVTIDGLDGIVICHGDMVGLDPDQFSILLVCFIDNQVATTSTGLDRATRDWVKFWQRRGQGYQANGTWPDRGQRNRVVEELPASMESKDNQ
jgi:hypothetical protein